MNHLDRVVMNALEGMPNDEYVPGEEIGECCMLVYNNQPMIRFLVLHWLIEHDDRCPVCGVWCGNVHGRAYHINANHLDGICPICELPPTEQRGDATAVMVHLIECIRVPRV